MPCRCGRKHETAHRFECIERNTAYILCIPLHLFQPTNKYMHSSVEDFEYARALSHTHTHSCAIALCWRQKVFFSLIAHFCGHIWLWSLQNTSARKETRRKKHERNMLAHIQIIEWMNQCECISECLPYLKWVCAVFFICSFLFKKRHNKWVSEWA